VVPTQTTLERQAPAATTETLIAAAQRLRAEVGKRIVGQTSVVEEVVMAMLAGGHALLVGVPGLAKTLMIRAISEARVGILQYWKACHCGSASVSCITRCEVCLTH